MLLEVVTPPSFSRWFNGFCTTGQRETSSAEAVEPLGQAQWREKRIRLTASPQNLSAIE